MDNEARGTIRRAVADYVNAVVKHEWTALGEGRKDKQAEESFSTLVAAIVETKLNTQLLEIVRHAGAHRADRVARSLARMPRTLAGLVNYLAGTLLLLVFLYPFEHWVTGVLCFAAVAVLLFAANFVLMDTDNPLRGAWNASPKPFAELREW
jgi:hypothetical protein